MTSFQKKTGVFVVNLGTPDEVRRGPIARYLREFLMDWRVVDIPWIFRWILVNLIIAPFRPKKLVPAYNKIWLPEGSPLKVISERFVDKLQQELGHEFDVQYGMRYQNPSIAATLQKFKQNGVDEIIVFPMFPQYSSAAYGSALEEVYRLVSREWVVPNLTAIPAFYNDEGFIDAIAEITQPVLKAKAYDKVLMSFHGIPERHCEKTDETASWCNRSATCCDEIRGENRNCYRAQSFVTARMIAKKLQLADDQYDVAFQSRLGRTPWIQPYTDEVVEAYPAKGFKNVLVLEPSFTVDCLETLEEIQVRAAEDFVHRGGKVLDLAPVLNDSEPWIRAAARLVRQRVATGK